MDISNETDITRLKALAYDQTIQLQVTQTNLQVIQQRLAQLDSLVAKETPEVEPDATEQE